MVSAKYAPVSQFEGANASNNVTSLSFGRKRNIVLSVLLLLIFGALIMTRNSKPSTSPSNVVTIDPKDGPEDYSDDPDDSVDNVLNTSPGDTDITEGDGGDDETKVESLTEIKVEEEIIPTSPPPTPKPTVLQTSKPTAKATKKTAGAKTKSPSSPKGNAKKPVKQIEQELEKKAADQEAEEEAKQERQDDKEDEEAQQVEELQEELDDQEGGNEPDKFLRNQVKMPEKNDEDTSNSESEEGDVGIPEDLRKVIPKVTQKPQAPIEPDVNSIMASCPNWSKELAQRYQKECAFWAPKFKTWAENLNPKSRKEVAYYCSSEYRCHGWGDRVAGMQGAFLKAIEDNQMFRIGHPYLHPLFSPCLFGTDKRQANWANYTQFQLSPSACVEEKSHCFSWLDKKCEFPQTVFLNSDRICIKREVCDDMLEKYPKVNAAQTIGCSLRAMFEPSERFMSKLKFPFKMKREEAKLMTLKEIEKVFQDYYVISIQMRLGDGIAFRRGNVAPLSAEDKEYLRPFRCASTVESFLSGASRVAAGLEEYEPEGKSSFIGSDLKINGKPVAWFLATDTEVYKQLAERLFGKDRLFVFDFKPEHIGLQRHAGYDLAKEIAEWYVLGLGQQLVVNKIGGNGDFYHGRLSGYAKTAWVYHLKHFVYDAFTCTRYSIPYEGTWSDLNHKACGQSQIIRGRTKFKQQHLLPLARKNVTFPRWFVSKGEVKYDPPHPIRRPVSKSPTSKSTSVDETGSDDVFANEETQEASDNINDNSESADAEHDDEEEDENEPLDGEEVTEP
jgi:hypothetical protein